MATKTGTAGMTEASFAERLRDKIISDPDVILEDRDLMRALIAANETAMGSNIVDLRSASMARLEARLDRLEDTYRSVIAAAHENLAGTHRIHRAVLRLLDPTDFESFIKTLGTDVARMLRVDSMHLVLESHLQEDAPALRDLGEVLSVAQPGFCLEYMRAGRTGQVRNVVLRQTGPGSGAIYGEAANRVRSEALMPLDLGQGRLPAMLVMGAQDPHQFKPSQGTDLLAFLAGVFERAMRRWLG